jgi:insulysin
LDRDSANPAHPLNRFATGNKDTLLTQSEKQGIDLRQSLLDFHAKYYTAGLMTLTVLGKQPVSDLERWVKSAFSRIPSGVQKEPALEWWGKIPPYLPQTSATVRDCIVSNNVVPRGHLC